MKTKWKFTLVVFGLLILYASTLVFKYYYPGPAKIISVTYNPKDVSISLFWKNEKGELFSNIESLHLYLEKKNKNLLFAMNAGMFDKAQHPIGLYIQNGEILKKLNNRKFIAKGDETIPNFYLQPNGIFYITESNEAEICETSKFPTNLPVKFAIQSGPMLLVNGEVNTIFKPGSRNYFIRNGLGITPDKKLIFAISENRVNFYDFAKFFKDQGCTDALFLDGYVSKAFIPEKNIFQTDGELGVLIGITKN